MKNKDLEGLKGLPVKLGILSMFVAPVGNARCGGAGFGG